MGEEKVMDILEIGAILGDSDSESRAWGDAIGELSLKAASQLTPGDASAISVNVIFHVDGRIAPNEFEGVRTGRFSKAKRLLVVQATIAKDPVDDRQAALMARLGEAVAEAENYVIRKRLAKKLPEIRQLVQRLLAND